MEKIKFKSSFFGFKRRQVLDYVNQTCQAYEQQLWEQKAAHETYRTQVEGTLSQVQASLENSRIVCAEQGQAMAALQTTLSQKEEELQKANALATELAGNLQLVTGQVNVLQTAVSQKEQMLSQRDTVIASQAVEVSRLQQQVSKLEEEFAPLRAENEQSTALVNCLNVLHNRNQQLLGQIAQLEMKLEDATHGAPVQEHIRSVEANQQTIASTEQLFAALHKEITDALATISSKIESGGITESEDGNYFVDMANL